MRYFIALEIPEESKAELKAVQNRLKQLIPDIRITDNGKLHLTIAFIGEQDEKLRNSLVEMIKNAVWEIKPFKIVPAYIDGFPNLHTARTFWVGIKGDIDKLFILRERIKDGLESLGIPADERRYIPHIAIGKIQNFNIIPFQEAQLEKIMSQTFKPIKITCIKLFESVPEEPALNASASVAGGGFHTHNTLAEVPLRT